MQSIIPLFFNLSRYGLNSFVFNESLSRISFIYQILFLQYHNRSSCLCSISTSQYDSKKWHKHYKKRVVNIPKEINKNILQICKLLHPDMLFVTSTVFSFLFLLLLCCRQNRRRILRGIKFMYNENEKRNIAVSQKGNAIQPAALNIHQLFPSRTKDECLLELKKNPSVYRTYLNWPDKWKNRFLEFMEGKKSLPLTYDPFFKKLFNPDIYPERLSRLIRRSSATKRQF